MKALNKGARIYYKKKMRIFFVLLTIWYDVLKNTEPNQKFMMVM